MKITKNRFLFLLLLAPFVLTACGTPAPVDTPAETLVTVKVQTVADSRSLDRVLDYPALVSAETEAKLIAKSSGTLSGADFAVGDSVGVGQSLAKINDVGINDSSAGGVNSNQIKQAIIASEQAQASYQLARSNYENLLISSAHDLKQAAIARDQAANSQNNLSITSGESIKSAELAYETAKISTEQARLNLDNKEKQLAQAAIDANQNAGLAASSAENTAGSVLSGINNLTSFDDNNVVNITYQTNLGALESSSYTKADNAYQDAQASYQGYVSAQFVDINARIKAAIAMTAKVKDLADATKYMFDKSIPSSSLPQSSVSGASLSGLQSSAATFQSQLNASLSQLQSAQQALTSIALNNESTIDALRKVYQLAQSQEASAAQNLSNLKAGNNTQSDQVGFAVNLAQNQYDNVKIKLDSQIQGARTQMETAQLQYNNASVALQNLYDIHSLVSPIAGVVTQKLANNGDTISAGQLVAVVSQTGTLRVKFFIEPEYVLDMKAGQTAQVVDTENNIYQGVITSVAASADEVTKRFQVELRLDGEKQPLLGTVVNAKIKITKNVLAASGEIILPLSVLEIGQNGTYLMLAKDNQVQRTSIELISVVGEMAKIKLEAPDDALIIIDGNKFLYDGEQINIMQ
ncbi:HlyD family efflux transporter periplasmic adaptor subunit [Patescibacteria group bacterium]|nr:HlyD family efflux transporter periplasmic adaptor subunit [Patescibacteria group bacterium]